MNTKTQETKVVQINAEDLPITKYLNTEKSYLRLKEAYQSDAMVKKAISAVTLEVARSPELQKCSRDSILQAIIDSANFGLIPNKLSGHAYLIPYKGVCTLQIGFKGYIDKFDEVGWSVECEAVTLKEIELGLFKEIRGTTTMLEHRPCRDQIQTEENIALVYAIAKKAGREPIVEVMSLATIMEVAKTQVWKDGKRTMGLKGVWTAGDRDTDFAEMCKKTVIRRLGKRTPIKVVNEMSSYEGTRDEMIDVTPQKPLTKQDDIMNKLKGEDLETHKAEDETHKDPAVTHNQEDEAKVVKGVVIHESNVEKVDDQDRDTKEVVSQKEEKPNDKPGVNFDPSNIHLMINGKKHPKAFVSLEHAFRSFTLFLQKAETKEAKASIINNNQVFIDALKQAGETVMIDRINALAEKE